MRVLITGSNGLLGQKIVKQCVKQNIDFLATSSGENRNSNCPQKNYSELDITSQFEIKKVVDQFVPSCIINTAAITNVDYCETHIDECQNVNVNSVRLLFDHCRLNNIQFIHLSTDFVFDGENGPYKESDPINPLSIYAKSKANSEQILINSEYKNWAILRTIIVFGEGENLSRSNIVLWAKSALEKGNPLTIVDDQFRAPTWADDLAWACLKTAKLNATGIFHISGPETFSVYDLVLKIGRFYQLNTSNIKPIKSNTLQQAAHRPPHTGFNIEKAQNRLNYRPKTFEEALKEIS